MNFRSIFLLVALLLSVFTFAQDEAYESLLSGDVRVSGFGGPMMKWSTVNDGFTFEMGGGGGLILQNALIVGGYGAGSTSGIKYRFEDGLGIEREYNFIYGYGGIWLGYMFKTKNIVHPTFNLGLAWGEAGFSTYKQSNPQYFYQSSSIFIVDPQIGLELNIVRWMRIEGLIGYRYVSGLDLETAINGERLIESDGMNGLTFGLNIKFGGF